MLPIKRWGSGGEPVVLVHGFLCSADVWGPAAALLGRSFVVIAVDLPGFGSHTAETSPDRIEDFAHAVLDTTTRLRLDPQPDRPSGRDDRATGGHRRADASPVWRFYKHDRARGRIALSSPRRSSDAPEASCHSQKRLFLLSDGVTRACRLAAIDNVTSTATWRYHAIHC
jgi:hypothetical protein